MDDKQFFYVDELNGAYVSYASLYEILKGAHWEEYMPAFPFLKLLTSLTQGELQRDPYRTGATLSQLMTIIQRSPVRVALRTTGGSPRVILHDVGGLTRGVGREDQPRWALTCSPYHMNGVWTMFHVLFNHGTLVNVFQRSRGYVLNQLRRHEVTHISAAPSFYRMLKADAVFPAVRKVIVSGEPIDQSLWDDLKAVFPNAKRYNVYITTETGYLLSSEGMAFGVPEHLQGFLRVKDQRLQVHRHLTGEGTVLEGEWFDTGDEVTWLTDGQFQITGKNTLIIKAGNHFINIFQVEERLRAVQGVREVAISCKPNIAVKEMLVVQVVLEAGSVLTEEDIRIELRRLLPAGVHAVVRLVSDLRWDDAGRICRD